MNSVKQSNENIDFIENLPYDSNTPSHDEIIMVDNIFKQKKGTIDKILSSSKDMIILAALFILLSVPFVDKLVNKLIPYTETSKYVLVVVKALLFVVLYFFIYNFYLIKKK